jgi:hypothetical protein
VQARDITGAQGAERLLKPRMRLESGDAFDQLDVVLESRPALETVLTRHDQLRVRNLQRLCKHVALGEAAVARVMRDNARGGRQPAFALCALQLSCLTLELFETRVRWQRTGGHTTLLS